MIFNYYLYEKTLMDKSFSDKIVANLAKILRDRNLTQAAMATYADTTPSQFSKILKGSVKLSLDQISNIAKHLSMSEIDLITYPDKYVKKSEQGGEPVEAVLQIKLQKEKKDQVLKMIFGENNLEILNK